MSNRPGRQHFQTLPVDNSPITVDKCCCSGDNFYPGGENIAIPVDNPGQIKRIPVDKGRSAVDDSIITVDNFSISSG